MKPYTKAEVQERLKDHPEWEFEENSIEKTFQFENFIQAVGFINMVALVAEKQNHHPEIYNVYNKVEIALSTHDANGVTDKDFTLAKSIDSFIGQ